MQLVHGNEDVQAFPNLGIFDFQTAMQLTKKLIPKSTAVTVVHGSDAAMTSAGLDSLDEARKAGLCVTGIYKADFFSNDYSAIVDSVITEAEKGMCLRH